MRKILFVTTLAFLIIFVGLTGNAQTPTVRPNSQKIRPLNCTLDLGFCREVNLHTEAGDKYIGHDEPAINFYSSVPGSGNSAVYLLTLPLDPPTPPVQDGGGTFNFQLHPAFWFGMNMCDTESYPEFSKTCAPDTDDNIFDNANPKSPRFIGKHPGTAFMELQFYPPGWIDSPQLIDPTNYFAALNVDSLGQSGATGVVNNVDCQNTVGVETVNFAVITKNGVPLTPANPLGVNFGRNNPDLNNVLSMAPGDQILVILHDTPRGLEVILSDLTNGQTGSMVSSARNGFGQVLFQPNSPTCNVAPYDFHPMYSTSNLHTRTPWSGGTSNVAFSDELGHFEFCDLADPNTLNCLVPGKQDRKTGLDADDTFCFSPGGPFLPGPPFIQVGGCTNDELDFDGQPYLRDWPGTLANIARDRQINPQPIRFTSPLFFAPDDSLQNFDRVAFETDMPAFDPNCDTTTGIGCTVPAQGMKFYPFYTTSGSAPDGLCRWQFGGGLIPGTINDFGGNPTAAWGNLFSSLFQTGPNSAANFITSFRNGLPNNPCAVGADTFATPIAALIHQ
ncbi:MAG: hypothetical protein WA738_21110 [Candidatus Angelobacter sp.]